MVDYGALVKRDRIHGSVYLSREIFDDEMEKIFRREWIYVGHDSEVAAPGEYCLRWIGPHSVIMVRGSDRKLRILLNSCRHRANALCKTGHGKVQNFFCPYHGWTYSTQGDLIAVPDEDGYDPKDFRKQDYGLIRVPRVASYRGLVFASLSPKGISLEEHLGLAREQIGLFLDLSPEGEVEVRSGVQKCSYRGNWKFQMENTPDGYHVNCVHNSFMDVVEKTTGVDVKDMFRGHSTAMCRDLGNGHVMLDSRTYVKPNDTKERTLTPAGEAYKQAMAMNVTSAAGMAYREAMDKRYGRARAEEIIRANGTILCVFPNLIIIGSQLRIIRPVSASETEVYYYPALLKGMPDEINVTRLRATERTHGPAGGTGPDDIELFETNYIGLQAQVDPWLLLARGLNREHRDADGSTVGHITDEGAMRGLWQHWKTVMTRT